MTITDKQKRHLKGLAHHLKPVVIIGQNGLTPAVINEIDIALGAHELIKVRVNAGDRDERQSLTNAICDETKAQLVQTIGHIAVFYRRHPKQPKVALPN
ncbi:MAG: ribosome assembly RNA-binding protein YhbY [Chromatiales bacterium]|nr:ribosome assembly RNA-binding protein YhbY [Chromatiales bacterium]